jgi:hypothetical protein
VSTAGTGYLALHATATTPCHTAVSAARRREIWSDWEYGDDRERRCRRVVLQGEVFVRLAGGDRRFCVECAAAVLGLRVRYSPPAGEWPDEKAPSCC